MSKSSLARTESERLVNRLRNTNPDKFLTMCKMHLSFLLDLPGKSLEEFLGENNSTDQKQKSWHFLKKRQKDKTADGLPGSMLTPDALAPVQRLIDFLAKPNNLSQEGLFRKSGQVGRQKVLKEKLWLGEHIKFVEDGYSAHDCASVLKSFLGELPEPLLTEKHYLAHCQVPNMVKSTMSTGCRCSAGRKQMKTVQLLLMLLPRENHVLLESVLMLLHKVAQNNKNKMTADTLGTLFSPHILVPRKLTPHELQAVTSNNSKAVSFMIEKAPKLFKVPRELLLDISKYWEDMEAEGVESEVRPRCAGERTNSTGDDGTDAVNTLVSFTDRQASQQADAATDTQVALAKLYAHVQCMPESGRKRKLLKQFNRANALHSPYQISKHKRTKSFGEAIKKHMGRKHKRTGSSGLEHAKENAVHVSQLQHSASPVHIIDISAKQSSTLHRKRKLAALDSPQLCSSVDASWNSISLSERSSDITDRSESTSPPSPEEEQQSKRRLPLKMSERFAEAHVQTFLSPISLSIKKAPKTVQTHMMTPRNRLPMGPLQTPP